MASLSRKDISLYKWKVTLNFNCEVHVLKIYWWGKSFLKSSILALEEIFLNFFPYLHFHSCVSLKKGMVLHFISTHISMRGNDNWFLVNFGVLNLNPCLCYIIKVLPNLFIVRNSSSGEQCIAWASCRAWDPNLLKLFKNVLLIYCHNMVYD